MTIKRLYHLLQKLAFRLKLDALCHIYEGYTVLIYHSVANEPRWIYSVSTNCFAEHLDYLQRNYEIKSIPSIVEAIKRHKDPNGIVCGIAFDDGYKDVFQNAYPLLVEYEVPATVFLSTGYISGHFKGREMLDWNEIDEMRLSGIVSIGVHSHTHPNLTSLPAKEALTEIEHSKRLISTKLSVEPDMFAVPGGILNPTVRNLIKLAGFKSVFTSEAIVNPPTQSPYNIGRICITTSDERLSSFAFKVCGLTDALLLRVKGRS